MIRVAECCRNVECFEGCRACCRAVVSHRVVIAIVEDCSRRGLIRFQRLAAVSEA